MDKEKHYLRILAKQYPSEREVTSEIINLQAILCLPKGTEHFISDIHGENEQFSHILRNGSGAVRRKIEEVLGNSVSGDYKKTLAALIFYPKEKLEMIKRNEHDMKKRYLETMHHLVKITKSVSSKYTRSKVRKAIPKDFVYIIEELITEKEEVLNKEAYYNEILESIIRVGEADAVIITLCNLIQHMVIDHLHVIGDLFDRGPGPDKILDTLCAYHSVDVQWGNHDVLWMGAAAGSEACIANVIRLCARYGNLSVLDEGYGINLLPLATFALQYYQNADSAAFVPEHISEKIIGESDELTAKMYHAITAIQFKLEGSLIKRRPCYNMKERTMLDFINYATNTIKIAGREYALHHFDMPTINPGNPFELTLEEKTVMKRLKHAFQTSEKLQKHIRFLYENGSLYKIHNGNLLFHGCIPMNSDGNFSSVSVTGKALCGKSLYSALENGARNAFFAKQGSNAKADGEDLMWYLWNGPKSPVYGRNKMATFERLFIKDHSVWEELKDPYYRLIDKEETANKILDEFSLSKSGAHIINGHVPVEVKKGETPIKCGGKVLMIDGGFSRAYHERTGISGYTLVCNSRSMRLVAHETFETMKKAIEEETDIISDTLVVENFAVRKNVRDTDIGLRLQQNIKDLEELLKAYRSGRIHIPAD